MFVIVIVMVAAWRRGSLSAGWLRGRECTNIEQVEFRVHAFCSTGDDSAWLQMRVPVRRGGKGEEGAGRKSEGWRVLRLESIISGFLAGSHGGAKPAVAPMFTRGLPVYQPNPQSPTRTARGPGSLPFFPTARPSNWGPAGPHSELRTVDVAVSISASKCLEPLSLYDNPLPLNFAVKAAWPQVATAVKMADHPPPSAFVTRGVLSLYDNIEDPNDPNPGPTTTAAPVVSKQEQEASADSKKPTNPALLFQPQIRRPPPKQAKGNKASLAPKVIPKPAPVAGNASTDAAATLAAPAKTSLADWAATEEDEWMYGTGEKPQRGGRKNKKKRQQQQSQLETNWDELYDAGKPTVLDEYNKSDETVNEAIEWNELLRRHGRAGSFSDTSSDDEEGTRQMPRKFPRLAPRPMQKSHLGLRRA